jgi:hypothetical protein
VVFARNSTPEDHAVSALVDQAEPDHHSESGQNESTELEAAPGNQPAEDGQDDLEMVEVEQNDQLTTPDDDVRRQYHPLPTIEEAPARDTDECVEDLRSHANQYSLEHVHGGPEAIVIAAQEEPHQEEVKAQVHAAEDELDDTCVDSGVDNSCMKQNEETRHSSVRAASHSSEERHQTRPSTAAPARSEVLRSGRVAKLRQRRSICREQSQGGLQIPAELSAEEVAQIWQHRCENAQQEEAHARATVKNIQQHLGELHNKNKGLQQALQETHDVNKTLKEDAAAFQDKYKKLKAFAKKLNTEMNVFRTDRQKHLASRREMDIAKQHYQEASADLQATANKVQEDSDKQRNGVRINIAAFKSDLSSHSKTLKSLQDLEKERHEDLRKEQIANDKLRKDVAGVRESQLSAEKAAQKHAELLIERTSEISANITKLPETLRVHQTEQGIKDCHQAVKAWDSKNLASQKDVGDLTTSVTRLQESVTSQETNLKEGFKESSAQRSKIEAATASVQGPVQQLLDRTQSLIPDLAKMQDLHNKNIELQAKAEGKAAMLVQLEGQLKEKCETIRLTMTGMGKKSEQDQQRQAEADAQAQVRYQSAKSNLATATQQLEAAKKANGELQKQLEIATTDLEEERKRNEGHRHSLANEKVAEANTSWQQKLASQEESAKKESQSLQATVQTLEQSLNAETEERAKQKELLINATSALDEVKTSSAQLEKDNAQITAQLSNTRTELEKLAAAHKQLVTERDESSADLVTVRANVEKLERSSAQLTKEKDQLAADLAETRSKTKDLQNAVRHAQKERDDANARSMEAQAGLEATKEENAKLNKVVTDLNSVHEELQRVRPFESHCAKLLSEGNDLKKKLETAAEVTKRMQNELDEVKTDADLVPGLRKSLQEYEKSATNLKNRLNRAEEDAKIVADLEARVRAKDERITQLEERVNLASREDSRYASVVKESQQKDNELNTLREEVRKLKVESQQRENSQLEVAESFPLPSHGAADQEGGPANRIRQAPAERDEAGFTAPARPNRRVADRSSNAQAQRPVLPSQEDSQGLTQNTDVVPDSQGSQSPPRGRAELNGDSPLTDLVDLPPFDHEAAAKLLEAGPAHFAAPLRRTNTNVSSARPSSSSSDLFHKHEMSLGTQRPPHGPFSSSYNMRPPQSGQGSQPTISPLRLRNGVTHGLDSGPAYSPLSDTAPARANTAAKRVADETPRPTAQEDSAEQPPKKRKRDVEAMSVRERKRTALVNTRERTPTPSQRGGSIIGTSAPAPKAIQRTSKAPRRGSAAEGYAKQFGSKRPTSRGSL